MKQVSLDLLGLVWELFLALSVNFRRAPSQDPRAPSRDLGHPNGATTGLRLKNSILSAYLDKISLGMFMMIESGGKIIPNTQTSALATNTAL